MRPALILSALLASATAASAQPPPPPYATPPAYGGAPSYPPTGYGPSANPPSGYGAPSYTAPGYSTPGYAAPGYAAPAYGAPAYGAPGQTETAARVSVAIGPRLLSKADRKYLNTTDFDELRASLESSVNRAVSRARSPSTPVRLDLVIEDAVPNRPTFSQLGRNVSLSFNSIGIGGASIGGTATLADGRAVPISFQWYETDIRNVIAYSTWGDADRAFQYFGYRVGRGDLKPYRSGSAGATSGDYGSRYGSY